uniref:Reverse transcriptase domain-containing protein n=1 Tax=Amphimedon queenslandica TaxID=400682 RepID=A0A1X7T3B8_AMPQE
MLRKVLEGERKNWDHMIPYVLFAYREVPQSTLGFSPFELLYGREVRGPLDVLKEEWIHNTEIETDILSFVMDTRERMESAREIVKENARAVQAKQKMYYDQRSREINFEVGDKVLLLLPSSTRKFVAKWQGPYEVIRKIGKVTYENEMPDKGGRKQIFHVNHLKKWKERAFVNAVIEDGEDIEGYRWSDTGEIVFGTQLTEDMKSDLWRVLRKFPSVTKNTPGKTDRIFHDIRTTDSQPIRQKPYRIPQAYLKDVMKELEEMERDGIIEKSSSEWASPLVIVKKKDGGIRLCVDYRQLNQVTKFDAYPMPRVEELLDTIGDAEFITTLDLAKGYWQVPVNEKDREKTAFTSPRGLYQFKTMPFGLSGAPATFQRMMDEILRGTETFAGVYLDDIVIHSSIWRDHLNQLTDVLKRLDDAGLTIKLKKCTF